jgi:hypothetical protein
MIQLPRRSVTRFFIPLIDVLTLLFCIFLLMPLIKPTGEASDSPELAAGGSSSWRATGRAAGEVPEMRRPTSDPGMEQAERERLRQERLELEQIRKEKVEALQQRLFIRVLEIDADTGKLFWQEGDDRLEIGSQDEALKLISRHRAEAGKRELYYLFLYPRRLTGYPEEGQVRKYESWFKGVAHGIDNPRAAQ